jgi:hypothetical protein
MIGWPLKFKPILLAYSEILGVSGCEEFNGKSVVYKVNQIQPAVLHHFFVKKQV